MLLRWSAVARITWTCFTTPSLPTIIRTGIGASIRPVREYGVAEIVGRRSGARLVGRKHAVRRNEDRPRGLGFPGESAEHVITGMRGVGPGEALGPALRQGIGQTEIPARIDSVRES